jgi:hypothetical protein
MAHVSVTPGTGSFELTLPDERALLWLMMDIAAAIVPGDFITLSGDLGAGKTTFARALIRYLARDSSIEVPSPTFTLIQTYDLPRYTIVHADLYRVTGAAELTELGFDDLPAEAVTLLEWPDRAAGFLSPDRFDIALKLAPHEGDSVRHVHVTGHGSCAVRAERIAAVRNFLNDSGLDHAYRLHIQGDASTRAYERLVRDKETLILMNAPKRPDGPPVRYGKPYSAVAHLAEDVRPFMAMASGLREVGLSAPAVYHADSDQGLLVLEDLGDEKVVAGTPPLPIAERYEAAVDVLAHLHSADLPAVLPISPHVEYKIPRYDIDAFLIEAELLLDWYMPRLDVAVTPEAREEFRTLWREALAPALHERATWVLRDYHSPNLIWLPERKGIKRVGILDFQDAVLGPAAYDLASLLQDARVDASEGMEITLVGRYTRMRREADRSFDPNGFVRIYAVLAAQRATKILGIFARLDMRDGKPQYLRHMPRIWGYLERALGHPALAPLKAWYRANVPSVKI